MAKQILLGLHGEGITDYRFLGQILLRYVPQALLDKDVDADLLLIIEIKGQNGLSFIEKMISIENDSEGIHGIFVHIDADHENESEVLKNKWLPFLNTSKNREIWIPIIPVKNIESWMLCDIDALSELFLLTVVEIEEVIKGRKSENISDGKLLLNTLRTESGQSIGSSYIQENLGKSISFQRLELLESFKTFSTRLEEFLDSL